MAKRRRTKINKWENTLWMILGVIALLGIGGLFVQGTFLNVVILKLLPQIVHTVVGYGIIGLTLLGVGTALYRKLA